MNEPLPKLQPETDVGPLDQDGQQIWSADEETAIARLHDDPDYWAGIERAVADEQAGRMTSPQELAAHATERRRRWLADRAV